METTGLPEHVITDRTGVNKGTISRSIEKHGWTRPPRGLALDPPAGAPLCPGSRRPGAGAAPADPGRAPRLRDRGGACGRRGGARRGLGSVGAGPRRAADPPHPPAAPAHPGGTGPRRGRRGRPAGRGENMLRLEERLVAIGSGRWTQGGPASAVRGSRAWLELPHCSLATQLGYPARPTKRPPARVSTSLRGGAGASGWRPSARAGPASTTAHARSIEGECNASAPRPPGRPVTAIGRPIPRYTVRGCVMSSR